jgi:hypothetical protein
VLARRQHRRGEPQSSSTKFYNGTLVFILLIVIIFLPLLLFSSANPVTSNNNVLETQVDVSLVGPAGEYRLLTISSMESATVVSNMEYSQMKQDRVIADDSQSNIQRLRMVPFSDATWDISAPSLDKLLLALGSQSTMMEVKLHYAFSRAGPPEQKRIDQTVTVPLTAAQQQQLYQIVLGTTRGGGAGGLEGVKLSRLVPKYLRLPANGSPIILTNQMNRAFLSLQKAGDGRLFWELRADEDTSVSAGIQFITISNPVFRNPLGFTTFTYSVVGLYSIVLLTIGRFVRLTFASLMVMIPFEDLHDVDDLVAFCESVYIARYTHRHYQEEQLYRRLVKVFRTPTLLVKLTRRKDD